MMGVVVGETVCVDEVLTMSRFEAVIETVSLRPFSEIEEGCEK